MSNNYYELQEEAIKALESRGHKVIQWQETKNRYGGGIYTGSDTIIKAYSNCIYCNRQVIIDVYPAPNSIDISGEAVALYCVDATKNPDGIALTTYNACFICGKESTSKQVQRDGYHNKCLNGELVIKALPNNTFKALAKFPKYNSDKYYPILSHIRVIVYGNGSASFTMTNLEKITTCIIDGVYGDCDICVPRDSFIDIVTLLDNEGDNFTITQDNESMSMIIKSRDSKMVLKGIDSQDFPNVQEILNNDGILINL